MWITPSDYNLKKFEWEVESERKRLKKPNIRPDVRQRRFKRLEAKVRSWTRGAFKLCDGIEEVNEYWVGQLKKVAPKSKPLWMG